MMKPIPSRICLVTLSVGITFGFCMAYILFGVVSWEVGGPNTRTPCSMPPIEAPSVTTGPIAHALGNDSTIPPTSLSSESAEGVPTKADELSQSVRVLCWVMTNPHNHDTKAKAVKDTWGPRCNILLFVSTEEHEHLPTVVVNVTESYRTLWGKTKGGFSHVYEHYLDSADWFMKADDDTYVVVENLRYMLRSHSPDDPIYFGRKFRKFASESYMSGGAGYVLSREALRRFVESALPYNELCYGGDEGDEDLEMGRCMTNVGVTSEDSRDHKGRGRFYPFRPKFHLIPGLLDETLWFWQYTNTTSTEGADCCSDTAISFHYIKPHEMYVLDYAIYHLHPYGTRVKPMETSPPRYQPLPIQEHVHKKSRKKKIKLEAQ